MDAECICWATASLGACLTRVELMVFQRSALTFHGTARRVWDEKRGNRQWDKKADGGEKKDGTQWGKKAAKDEKPWGRSGLITSNSILKSPEELIRNA